MKWTGLRLHDEPGVGSDFLFLLTGSVLKNIFPDLIAGIRPRFLMSDHRRQP
jgi:hypothetical protein